MAHETATERGVGRLILRGVWILVAVAVSALLAAIVLLAIGGLAAARKMQGELPTSDFSDIEWLIHYLEITYGAFGFAVMVVPILSVLPALLVVVYGEVARRRGLLYYVVGGGLAAVVLPVLASPVGTSFNSEALAGFATAGFVGGLVYWLLAGRNA